MKPVLYAISDSFAEKKALFLHIYMGENPWKKMQRKN